MSIQREMNKNNNGGANMSKKIISLVVVLLCVCTPIMASQIGNSITDSIKDFIDNIIQEDNTQYIEKQSEIIKNQLERVLQNKTNLKNADEFLSIIDCYPIAKRENIKEYLTFMYKNNFTVKQIDTINKILINGTTIQSLIEVYEFWLTTDEDFSMIEKICALEDTYFSEYWYEKAFNVLTDYKHGALTSEDIINYREKGISDLDIMIANVMCRKEGQNINKILDSLVEGISLEKQARLIYGEDVDLSKNDSLKTINEISKNKRRNKTITTLIGKKISQEQIDIFDNLIDKKIENELKKLQISNIEYDFDDEILSKSNYPISVQRALKNKGYTPEEISKSETINELNPFVCAKKAREMIKNEK